MDPVNFNIYIPLFLLKKLKNEYLNKLKLICSKRLRLLRKLFFILYWCNFVYEKGSLYLCMEVI